MHCRHTFFAFSAALAVLASASVAAQSQNPAAGQAPARDQQVKRAQERCSLNHGVDCDTPQGLQEWLLQDRSREEAVSEGARHIGSSQGRSSASGR